MTSLSRRVWLCFALIPWLLCIASLAALSVPAYADDRPVDPQTVRDLLARVAALEARVHSLEAEKAAALAPKDQAQPSAQVAAPDTTQASLPAPAQDQGMGSQTGSEFPRLRIRGFSDIRYAASNQKGSTNSFVLGQFDLFITSKLSDNLSVLSESVIEADDETNEFGIELERLLLNYDYSEYFNVGFGRYHSAIGYYNTAYHHSTWMQTTVDRPFLFAFEDDGGILPIHNVGITATGRVPSGALGLHYVAEIGNGRATRTELGQGPVQNVTDENNGKSFNLALYARPDSVPGLQVGFSGYHDNLTPLNGPNVDERIVAGHAIYQKSSFEFMNEALLTRHQPDNGLPADNSVGFYSQISHKWGAYRPYFRYEYLNVPDRDLIYPDVHRLNGPLFGLRYDWSEFSAFKVEYQRTMRRNDPSFNTLTLQTSFAF